MKTEAEIRKVYAYLKSQETWELSVDPGYSQALTALGWVLEEPGCVLEINQEED